MVSRMRAAVLNNVLWVYSKLFQSFSDFSMRRLMPVAILLNDLEFAWRHRVWILPPLATARGRPLATARGRPLATAGGTAVRGPLATAGVRGATAVLLLRRGMFLLAPLAIAIGAARCLGLHLEHRGAGASKSARPSCGGRIWTLASPPYDCGEGGHPGSRNCSSTVQAEKKTEISCTIFSFSEILRNQTHNELEHLEIMPLFGLSN